MKRRVAYEADEFGGGVVANIIDRAFENPATSGGLMVMALTATAIVSNAMFLQNGRHPDPLFASNPAPVVSRTANAPPAQALDPGAQEILRAMPPLPHLAPTSEAAPVAAAPVADQGALITEIQRELARLGLYSGTIDGIAGSRTAAAIAEWETAAGLPKTGKATPQLLAAMRAPLPTPDTTVAVAPAVAAVPSAAELDKREQERAAKIAAEQQAIAAARMQANAKLVQDALNRAGYGPVPIDGQVGSATANAIRRFELDNGLPITGEVNDRLMGRLISIGALKAG